MFLTPKDRAVLLQRTGASWEAYRRQARAAGTCLTYGLEDLRALVEHQLAQGICPHCHGPVTAVNVTISHKLPIARGGKFTFRNLDVCCHDCAACKGVLDAQEFRELLLLLRSWPKPVQQRFRAGLAAAAAHVPADLPRPGSLEWFTGMEPSSPSAAPRGAVSSASKEIPHEVHHG